MYWLGVLTGLVLFPVGLVAYVVIRWRIDSGEWP